MRKDKGSKSLSTSLGVSDEQSKNACLTL